jgi:thiol-disulfide isomerase/thioredoxin
MRRALLAPVAGLVAGAVLTLAGCTADSVPAPGPARIDVDTPQLRELKQEAGVERCVPGTADPVAGGLPDVTLPCLGGGRDVDLAALRGPMLVSLWASWCGPCRHELPVLQQFHERYGDRVAVLGIDYTDPQTVAALELARDSGVTYPLLADPQSALSAEEPFPVLKGMPFFALVGADGRVVHQEFGGIESEQQLVGLVQDELGVAL